MRQRKNKNSMKKKKNSYVDDGHTIYSMAGLKTEKKGNLEVNKRERKAIIKAALAVYLPRFLLVILAFTLTFILIYFWLN